jgi:AraC-like DNA-binding protein
MHHGGRYSDQMARRIRLLQRGAFDSLLRGDVYSEDDARAILPYLEVRYESAGFCIVLVRVRRPSAGSAWVYDDTDPAEDAERALRVHIGQYGYVCRRTGDELVILFSNAAAEHGDGPGPRLAAAAAEIESRTGATLHYAVSNWRTALSLAGRSLQEAEARIENGGRSNRGVHEEAWTELHRSDDLLCEREPGRAIQRYILGHYADPGLALGRVAREFGLTETYLSQISREQTGVSYSLFLEQTRVEAARHLLESSTTGIAEIASRVGYRTNSTFFRAFRRVFGESPSSYRKSNGVEEPVHWS